MREKPRDPGRLQHMLMAIDNIFNFMDGKVADDLNSDSMLYFAVVKNVEIIGEAAYKLTNEFKESHPGTPWRLIIAMRHVLVHGYYEIKSDEVWGVVKNRLQPLKEQLERYITEFGESGSTGNHTEKFLKKTFGAWTGDDSAEEIISRITEGKT